MKATPSACCDGARTVLERLMSNRDRECPSQCLHSAPVGPPLEPIWRNGESCCVVIKSFSSISYASNANLGSKCNAVRILHAPSRVRQAARCASQRSKSLLRTSPPMFGDRLSSTCLPVRDHGASASLKTGFMTTTFMTSKSQEGVAQIDSEGPSRERSKRWIEGSKNNFPATENFFPNSSQLAKKPRETFWNHKIQVTGGCTYSTSIRTTLPF